MVAGQQCDRDPLAGLAQLSEEGGMLLGDGRELRYAGAIGQLPEAERIADDDELGGLGAGGDLPQERNQLVLEVAAGESAVAADVEVADEVVGRRRRRHQAPS